MSVSSTRLQRLLAKTRDPYYAVEKWIPLASHRGAQDLGRTMEKALRRGRTRSGNLPKDLAVFEALRFFFRAGRTSAGVLVSERPQRKREYDKSRA